MTTIEIIKNISSVLGLIISLSAVLGIVIKPIRKCVVSWIIQIIGGSDTLKGVEEIKDSLNVMNKKIDDLDSRIDNLDGRLEKLNQRVFENERDRIKSELSECASRCMRGIKLYPEEMIHINEIYAKYSDELHCNSTGSTFYHEIVKYYESQDWIKSK